MLSYQFDNKKKYNSVSVILPNIKEPQQQIFSAIDEVEKNKIAVLPIPIGDTWTSLILWQENGQSKALFNSPNFQQINEDLKIFLLSLKVEITDLQFSQQINTNDSGAFVVDNLIKVADFLLNHEEGFIGVISKERLPVNLELVSDAIIGETIEGQERKVSSDVNAIGSQLRYKHSNIVNEIEEDKVKNLSTTFRPIYDHRSNKLHIPDSRPPTSLGKNQGEHVTNWSFYKRAVKKIIEGNAEDLETCKNELISLVGLLVLEENKVRDNEFLNCINDLVRDYNSQGRTSHLAISNKEQRDAINREAKNKVLAEMARSTLSIINRLPDVTHPEEGNIKAEQDGSGAILNRLDKVASGEESYDDVNSLVTDVLTLMHYPYVPEHLLKPIEEVNNIKYQGRSNSSKYNKKDLKTRTNDSDIFSNVLARHINLAKINYPNLITDEVVTKIIEMKQGQWLSDALQDSNNKQDIDFFKNYDGKESVFCKIVKEKINYRRKEFSPTKPPKTKFMDSSDSGSASIENDLASLKMDFVENEEEVKYDLQISNGIIVDTLSNAISFYGRRKDGLTLYSDFKTELDEIADNCRKSQIKRNEEISEDQGLTL